MELLLPCAYAAVLAAQICLLIRAVKRGRWTAIFCLELAALTAAAVLAAFFDRLPGYGMMPGLTWFSEFIFSLGAAAVYGLMLAVSGILWIAKKNK